MEKIVLVTSLYNADITQKLEEAALHYLNSRTKEENILKLKVPGSFEIPLAIQWCFEKNFSGALALGCLIRGETSHFDRIGSHLEKGLTQLQLTYQKPIGFGVLTTENKEQALNRSREETQNRGREAAKALMDMLEMKKDLKSFSFDPS